MDEDRTATVETNLPKQLCEAVVVTTAGATGVARMVIEGLLEIVDDAAAVARAIDFLTSRLTGYAPIWHITNAVRRPQPAERLHRIRVELDDAVDLSVAAARRWVLEHGGGPVDSAPSSSIVREVLNGLDAPSHGRAPTIALAGADAIGPTAVLNICGTRELAARLPTLVVTTSLKLVPGPVFDTLGAPVFEPIPLSAFAGVVLDGEIVSPQAAGRRAAELRG